MPWKSVYKDKTERVYVLLLGGSIYDDCDDAMRISNRRRRGETNHRTKHALHIEEALWRKDFHTIISFFEKNHLVVWRSIPAQYRSDRNEAWQLINEFFDFERNERKTYVIYWCGHGTLGTGDWGFTSGGEISCADLINAWRSHHGDQMSSLTVIADTCHSGTWVELLSLANLRHFAYQAACRPEESAYLVNDGHIPRSLLMRKFLIEQTYSIEWYPWTCADQHPMHFCDGEEIENGKDLSAGQRRTFVNRARFCFFTVDRHWTSNGKIINREQQKEFNQLAKYGAFIDNL